MASFRRPDWARRLLEEEKGTKPWGYAQYVDPLVADHFDHANTREGVTPVVREKISHQDRDYEDIDAANEYVASLIDDNDRALGKNFQSLREHLTTTRDRPRVPRYGRGSRHEGLIEGVLANTCIVIDGNCVSSLYIDHQCADIVWVWAVDPDYHDVGLDFEPEPEFDVPQYRGFLRVRVQQLADKFFEARRFRPETSMFELWSAAQNSNNKAFVSLDLNEQKASTGDSISGSALGKSRAGYNTSR